jgi:hypothetical protein
LQASAALAFHQAKRLVQKTTWAGTINEELCADGNSFPIPFAI